MGMDAPFSHKPMKNFINFMSNNNMGTQAVAEKNAGSDPDLKTTGTAPICVGGVFVASLTAQATLDLTDSDYCDCAGETVADGEDIWMLVLTEADGTPYVMKASEIEASAELSIPHFDGSTYAAIGLVNYINDSGSDFVIGTTNLDGTDCVIYQVIGNVMPDPDNWDKN